MAKVYVCHVCGKTFETLQQLGGHIRMAHPKKRGRKTKERLYLDLLKAIVEAPVKLNKEGKPAILMKDLAEILKTTPEKIRELSNWGSKNGYEIIAKTIINYKRSTFAQQAEQSGASRTKAEQLQQSRTR